MARQKSGLSLLATVVVAAVVSMAVVYFMPTKGGSGSPTKTKESVYDRVMRTGTIRCGYGISPPALMVDPNTKQVSGLDYDIWQEIGKELGLRIEFSEEAGWGNFIEGLKTGRYDAFCGQLWPSPVRVRELAITLPVMYSFAQTFVRVGDHRFDGNLDRANQPDVIIPAVEGDVTVAMAKDKFPDAKIYYLPQTATVSDMAISIQTKKADIMFLSQEMVAPFEKQNPGVLRMVTNVPPSFVFPSYYGVLNSEGHLRDMINVALRKIVDDGRMEKMARRYSDSYIIPSRNYDAP